MDKSCESESNSTFEREWHPAKHSVQSVSTEEGMTIDESDEQSRNARSPMNGSREPEPNVTPERDRHRKKQSSQSSLTAEGIKIDDSDEQRAKAQG
jgi:hypothetical protein